MKDYIKKTIETYNKTADEYVKNVKGLVPMNELEKFVKYIPHGSILDIGCGSGVSAKNLKEKGLDVTGIDLSEKLLEASRLESPGSNFYKMDMRNLDFKNKSFDGIWQMASLLHLEKKDVPLSLNENYRVLKPEGILYLSVKGGSGEGIEFDKRYGGLPKHYTYFEKDEINSMLKDANFEVLENYSLNYNDSYRIDHPWMNIFARKK